MKTLEISRTYFVVVDDCDYDLIANHPWIARPHRKTVYAQRNFWFGGMRTTLQMHREILGLKNGDGKIVDHINGDGLDNRRENLRICSVQANNWNRRLSINNSTGFKGVHFRRQENKYWAYINILGKRKHLGIFPTAIEAALAYNEAASKLFGEFARLNRL